MSLVDILLTIILICIFCLGFRTLISEGMILHFIRKPFEYEKDSKMMNIFREKLRKKVLITTQNPYELRKRYTKLSDIVSYILKPFLLCVICFSSVWGSVVFISLNGLRWELILCCISSAFIIKVINDHVEF